MYLLFMYLSVALFTSFICSVMESVLLSTPIAYLKGKAGNENKSIKSFSQLKENIEKPLSAILTLNTIAHTVGAAGVGSQATIVFGEVYFGIVSAVLTILILVFTEIIPKTIGAIYYRQLIFVSVKIINAMIFLTYPIVFVSALLTRLLSKNEIGMSTSREEFAALANLGLEEGVFGEKENKIIQNLLKLKSIKVSEVMTPRVVVVAANENITFREIYKKKRTLQFSRIPIFEKERVNVTGYILRDSVLEHIAEDKYDVKIKTIARNITKFPKNMNLFDAWENLLSANEHIALIIDEYGGMSGIVTFEDIIETLFGIEILDEKDRIADMQQYALERWKKRQEKYKLFNSKDLE